MINLRVTIEKTNKQLEFGRPFGSALLLLRELAISPDSVLVVRNGEVILSEEALSETDEVVLLSVVSGG